MRTTGMSAHSTRGLLLWLFILVICSSAKSEDVPWSCVDDKCLSFNDPCPGICQGNASCQVHNRMPYCACNPGYTGNPFTGCQQEVHKESCSPTVRKKYRVERFLKVNWFAAFLHCQGHGGRLAAIESKEDNNLIKEAISKTNRVGGHFWTSGMNFLDGLWFWFSTGQSIEGHVNWHYGQPNSVRGKQHCLELYDRFNKNDYLWNDVDCNTQMYPICEFDE